MKALVIGSGGFIGRETVKVLAERYDVYGASLHAQESEKNFPIDLSDPKSVRHVLETVRPDVIINCAGIVGGPESDLNEVFTTNILKAVAELKLPVSRVVISGSAGEYGRLRPEQLPVSEDTPLGADAGYGLSKVNEEKTALSLGHEYGISVVVARIFNPIGRGMGPKFLVPSLLRQLDAVRAGKARTIELSRLDSERDYIHVHDVARAYVVLLGGRPSHDVYNVGSGKGTSNGELVRSILEASGMPDVEVKELADEKEPTVASQANISRIQTEFGWHPEISLRDAVEEIVRAK